MCVACEINYTYIYLMYEIIISIIHETLCVLSILNGFGVFIMFVRIFALL